MSNKRNDKESMISLTPKQSLSLFIYRIQTKKKFTEKELFKKNGVWKIEQKNEIKAF